MFPCPQGAQVPHALILFFFKKHSLDVRVSRPKHNIGTRQQFPKTARRRNSIIVLLSCPASQQDLGTTVYQLRYSITGYDEINILYDVNTKANFALPLRKKPSWKCVITKNITIGITAHTVSSYFQKQINTCDLKTCPKGQYFRTHLTVQLLFSRSPDNSCTYAAPGGPSSGLQKFLKASRSVRLGVKGHVNPKIYVFLVPCKKWSEFQIFFVQFDLFQEKIGIFN